MPTPARVYTYAAEIQGIALNELEWTMYELPTADDRYWHGRDAFTVREIDQSQEPPHVHLVHDQEWSRQVRSQLPEGYEIEGGRSSDDGHWHFMAVVPPHGHELAPVFAENLDEALGQAITNAAEHYRNAQQAGG